MGGGPEREVLLFIQNNDEPKHILDPLRRDFPHLEVIFHKLSPSGNGKQKPSAEDVPASLWQKATILVTMFVLPPKPDLAPNLKWIQVLSAGVDHLVNEPIFKDTDIPITTASGIHGPAITEWVVMTTLALSKNYNFIHENQKRHKWDGRGVGLLKRKDWQGRTVGIAGYGSIGRQVARVFKAMGCNIHAYTASPRSTPESRRDDGYVIPGTGDSDGTIPDVWYSGSTKSGLHTFLSSGLDVLLVSVPLTPATTHLFGKEEFEVLYKASLDQVKSTENAKVEDGKLPAGEGCIISNIARGPVLDQQALITALKDGKLQGAALDVTDPEPLPEDNDLWDLENAIVTPHISGHFSNYIDRAFDIVRENLRRLESGDKLLNVVRRDKGY